jgi:hypothetical protein
MMFTKEVDEAMVEVTNEDEDGEGVVDAGKPEIPKDLEDISSNKESEDDLDRDVPAEDNEPWINVMTRSGLYVKALSRLIVEGGKGRLASQKRKNTIIRSWIRAMKLSLILKSLFVLELLLKVFPKYSRASCQEIQRGDEGGR